MKKVFSLFLVAFVATTTVLAYPVAIYTSCGIHNTDTVLWGDMTKEEIHAELEAACDQDQAGPVD